MPTNTKQLTALITGANNGIGLELTRKLLSEGWQVIALVRSDFTADDQSIQEARTRRQLRVYRADLTDFTSLKPAIEQIKGAEEYIDVLFNNAGGSAPALAYSPQGREIQFELHTLVPYVMYMELKELLQRGTSKTVVNTSTSAFKYVKEFDPVLLERPASFRRLFGSYAATKLALSLWTRAIAPQAAAEGIRILSADPGGNNTLRKGKDSGLPFYVKPMMKLLFPPPSKGASLLYHAAASQAAPGSFLVKGKERELKFIAHANQVLERMQALYRAEFKDDNRIKPAR
ncbi:SDR family NAD(P)-dependent oxidoreductase [Paenibacillus donghaensis]|uniref:Short-chain dehydrogenase n=1 Tax=Paenibacillus donghaensis TaxID=414771 RepID=A0A2Z2KBT3_9BACL|nr:SDR family NAD(P)-dependent oxidoreductase [Paenibacillus donghaensis]ASA23017.1 short-chain dehydrogenase [Paenibacillus donghaensis]